MQQNSLRTLGLAALVTLLQSCGDPKSSSTSGPDGGPVATNRMTIDLRVESSESGIAVVRANLNDGQALGESYRLDGGDFFRACVNGVCRNMADNDSLTSPDYIARFDFLPGVDYVVAFNRQGAQNAPDSRVTLPPAFTIVTPANHQQVTDGETVVVSWTPTGAPARASLSYFADCPFPSGSHSFSSGTLSTDSNADGRESVRIDAIVDFARASATVDHHPLQHRRDREPRARRDESIRHSVAAPRVGIVSRKVNLDYIAR